MSAFRFPYKCSTVQIHFEINLFIEAPVIDGILTNRDGRYQTILMPFFGQFFFNSNNNTDHLCDYFVIYL